MGQKVLMSQIVLCIPTVLTSRQAIASALVDKYGTDYLFMGRLLRSNIDQQSCSIDICDRDLNLASDFALLGQETINAATLTEIEQHKKIIYLISTDTKYDACILLAKLAQIFITIGGIGVKVDSGEIVHSSDKWLANYNSKDVFDIYSLYVALVEGDEQYYSCGMQNFGKADVAVSITEDVGMAIYLMNVFNYYRLTESPILQEGHTFRPDIESPRYKMNWMIDTKHESDSQLYNSHGRWHLSVSNKKIINDA